jgi:AraC-like DNA-binding protein
MFTYGPGVPHRIETDPDRPLLKYFVDFRPGAAPEGVAIPSGAAWSSAGLPTVAVEGIRKLLDELIRLGAASATPPKVLDHLLSAVLLLCQPVSTSADGGGADPSVALATYRRCRQVIDQRALELRSLEQAATTCGVDAAYLCRMFRRFDTLTPYQRLLQARMNHAAARLRSGPVLVKEVAAELGYSDPFHFSRVFRRVVGMPPGRFRG